MKKVVVIEDDDDAWFLLKELLTRIGYKKEQLLRFASIEEIVSPELPAEIVLTDLTLPDSAGPATFKAVCRRFPYSPIVVITGNADTDAAVNLIKEGAQDYLVKSEIDARILQKSIQYAIERKKITADYRRIFVNNPTPMYILDGQTWAIVAVNDAAVVKYGYTREEFLQLNGNDIRPAEEIQRFREHVKTHTADQYDAGIWKHKKKDGTVFAVHVFVHYTEFDGRYSRMVVAIDVDKELQVEKALAEKVRENDELMDRMTDAFFTVNENHEFTYVNSTFEKLLQKTRGDLMGKNIWEMFPEAVGLKFYEGYYKAINQRVNVFFEELLPSYGLWLFVKAYPLDKGLAVYFVDITEQKLAQEKLALEEQNLRAIINNTEDIIWSVDRQYNIISANEAFWQFLYHLTGKQKNEITQADFNNDLFQAWAGMFDRAFAGETFKTVWTNDVNGEKFYSEISFNPIRADEGEVVGVSCFSRDITHERAYLQKIEAHNKQLRDIAWLQSHKVRNHVATMMGLVQLANTNNLADPANLKVLEGIKLSAEQLDEVIREINDITQQMGE